MKANEKEPQAAEPVGIVISSGWTAEKPSVFSAYLWAQPEEVTKGKTAA